MTLSELSIRRPVLAWMLMAALIVFGGICFLRLGISQSPDIDFPIIEVSVNWDGAAPEILETEIVDRLEQSYISLEGLKEVRSTIRQGAASISLEFDLKREIDSAVQEVQTKTSGVRLPLGVDPPTIKKNNPEEEPILWLGFGGERSLHDLIAYADLNLSDQLQVLPGVGEVQLLGFAGRNLRVWMKPEKLKEYELTVLDVVKAMEQQHTEVAAGYLENAKQETNVRTMGEGYTAEDVGAIRILQRGSENIYGSDIRVRDVARVEDGLSDIRALARVTGAPGIGIGIKKQRGSNEVEIGRVVREKVEEIKKTLPKDLRLQVNIDFTRFTAQTVHHTMREMLLAGGLTALICFLFLGSWSSSFNVILSIPTSVLGTFIVMYFAGFTLNTFTLLGLALAIGIIVDDAIMVLENIVRHFQMGKKRRRASLDGAREINFAAIAATVAIIAIFLPVAFMSGVIGKFFFQFGITISVAVLLSLLEAITLTPMRCSQFMQRDAEPNALTRTVDDWFHRLGTGYARSLNLALRHRVLVFSISIAVFLASLWLGSRLRREMVPPQDQNFFRCGLQMPVGTSLAATNEAMLKAEAMLKKMPEVDHYFAVAGGLDGRTNTGFMGIALTDKDQRTRSQAELMNLVRSQFSSIPGILRATPSDLSLRGLQPGRPMAFSFNIRGHDYAVLNAKSQEILAQLKQTGLVVDLDTDYRAGMPELRIVPDREAASKAGVSVDAIAQTVNAAIGGLRQGKFTRDGRRYDARISVETSSRREPSDLNQLTVRTNYRELIPLPQLVKMETSKVVQTISRVNRQRSISIFGNITPGRSQADALVRTREICDHVLPEGYSMHLEGGSQAFEESLQSLWVTLALGIVVAYMVLASQFNSFLHPVTVLLALPFAFTGAFTGLWLTGCSINLYSMMGVILLMGIAKKNSIMLVEFANHLREQDGLGVQEAILQACPIRLRPILMTSLATLTAALPTALGHGAGSEARAPMAITILGGVLVSTFFTLYVVPCAYIAFSRWERPAQPEEEDDHAPNHVWSDPSGAPTESTVKH